MQKLGMGMMLVLAIVVSIVNYLFFGQGHDIIPTRSCLRGKNG